MKLSLVIPCYNEQDNVELFYNTATEVFKDKGFDYELIFVNDGSRDQTMDKLRHIYEIADENVKVVGFSRNFGKESAIYAGLKESRGEMVCLIDADMQQRPELVLDMMAILDKDPNYDAVACYQEDRRESKVLSAFKDCFYKIINKTSEIEFKSGASDFRLLRRCVVDAVLSMSEYHRFSKGIFSWVGFNTYYMPYIVEDFKVELCEALQICNGRHYRFYYYAAQNCNLYRLDIFCRVHNLHDSCHNPEAGV